MSVILICISDQDQLLPLIDAINGNLGRKPKEASADAGYCSEVNIGTLIRERIEGCIATGRQKHGVAAACSSKE